jgi:hypothetical protein
MAVAGEIRGRGRPWQGLASGYPPSPRCQPQTTRGKRVEGDLLGPEKILADYYPLLVSFEKKNRVERGIGP